MSETRTPITDDEKAIEELTTRAIAEIYPSPDDLAVELRSGRVLRAYLGIDPTAPDLHVGHESQLLKLRRLQQLGHEVILLIGDFTGMIGDPSDKSATRVRLSKEEVMSNAEGYRQQAGKIIDFEDETNPAQLMYNSHWLGEMSFEDVLELAGEFSVQQMIERNMFRQRISAGKPVWLNEFLYPLMQGWDSVSMAVDIEVGGSDQIFNMLAGRDLVKRHLDKEKFVIAGKMLEDPTGRKIGKTEGNMITLNDSPADMFHKIMLWSDEITPHALELCTKMPMSEIREIEEMLRNGTLSGLDGKKLLAMTVIAELHGPEASEEAKVTYETVTAKDSDLTHLEEGVAKVDVEIGQNLIDILHGCGIAPSRSAARRLIEGGAVRINGKKVEDMGWTVEDEETLQLQVGKRKLENSRILVIKK